MYVIVANQPGRSARTGLDETADRPTRHACMHNIAA